MGPEEKPWRQEDVKSSREQAPASEEERQPAKPFRYLEQPTLKGFVDLPKVIHIIIPIKRTAEESNEEALSDGPGINKVFLDLSI